MKADFPDPGKVTTAINYCGETTSWRDDSVAPEGFEKVHRGFINFLRNGWSGLIGWMEIRSMLQNRATEDAKQAIQSWVDRFRTTTFGNAFREIFSGEWNQDDFQRFDTVGIGSGGLGIISHAISICRDAHHS